MVRYHEDREGSLETNSPLQIRIEIITGNIPYEPPETLKVV